MFKYYQSYDWYTKLHTKLKSCEMLTPQRQDAKFHMARTRRMYFAYLVGVVRKTFGRAAFFFDDNVLPNSGAMQYAAATMTTTTPHISLSI